MELLTQFIDFFLHLDTHLDYIIKSFGMWSYLILFLIIFVETGIVIFPFLPGDSLIFACGTLAALGSFNPILLFVVMFTASMLGDNSNYHIGKYIGPKIFKKEKSIFLNKDHLEKTHKFYEKHGGKAVIFAKFAPIIRTFSPFVSGVGRMDYSKFLLFDFIGSLLWVGIFIFLGYFFGNIPVVKNNFEFVIFGIIGISLLPAILGYIKSKRA